MDNFASLISEQLPHLAKLLGSRRIRARESEFQRRGMAPLWQVERDLGLLSRHASWAQIARAYRDLLRNPGQLIEGMYEIRVAAMLAPFAEELEFAPKIGQGKCDLKWDVGGKEVFVEVTTRKDEFPFTREDERSGVSMAPLRGRVTVEASFDPTTARDDPGFRSIPAPQELRERISEETHQLPSGRLTLLVVGAPGGRSLDMESALWGDEVIRAREGIDEWWRERVGNGLFRIPDDIGGVSKLAALAWMKLVRHFHDVRVHSRLFMNPLATCPLTPEIEEVLRSVFDRRAVLLRELERIKKTLLEQYHPERIILFGSLADDSGDRVHEWSDIDLAIVKPTSLRFTERIGEVMHLLQPRVGLNVLVFTPEEFDLAEREGRFFVRDEILKTGKVLFPADV